jgi:hypothetical protein
MNSTNHITKTADAPHLAPDWLPGEIRARHLPLESNATPGQVIPWVHKFIKRHLEIGTQIPVNVDSYPQWKATLEDWQQFLAQVETLARLPYENAGTAKFHIGETTKTPAAAPAKKQTVNNAFDKHDTESLIKEVEKYLAENDKKAHAPQHQQHPTVPPPSDQASDPRLNPVCDPSQDASDASTDASSKTSPDQDSAQAHEEYLAQMLRESTSRSPIDDFPPERQQQLYELIIEHPYTHVAQMIAQPEPIGWNFQTSDTSLKRFKKRYDKKLEREALASAHREAEQTVQQTGANEQTYTDATRRLLKIRVYRNAADPKGSEDKLELLTRLLDRQRRTDLAERRVQVLEHRANQKQNQ